MLSAYAPSGMIKKKPERKQRTYSVIYENKDTFLTKISCCVLNSRNSIRNDLNYI